MVEQRTFNPFVVGSIPAHPTNLQSSSGDEWFGGAFRYAASPWLADVGYEVGS